MRYFESVHENVRLFEGVYVSACRTFALLFNICLNSLLTEENKFSCDSLKAAGMSGSMF
jgi:hypothetical protein